MSIPAEAAVTVPAVNHCRDCGAALPEAAGFCPACGQETQVRLPRVFDFLREAADETVGLSGRLPRTLALLLSRPGQLTSEYIAGRRQRYVRPMRLYLSVSLVFFGLLGIATSDIGWLHVPSSEDTAKQIQDATRRDKAETSAPDTADAKAAAAAKSSSTQTPAKGNDRAASKSDEPVLPVVDFTTLDRTSPPPKLKTGASKADAAHVDTKPSKADAKTADGAKAKDDADDDRLTDVSWLERRVEHYKSMPHGEIANTLIKGIVANAPYAVFILMPLAALWYQLFYVFRGRRYAEHLLHAVHLHCFVFCIGTLALIPMKGEWWVLLIPVLGIYTVAAEMRVYGSGLWRALVGTTIGSFLYLIGISITALLLAFIALAI